MVRQIHPWANRTILYNKYTNSKLFSVWWPSLSVSISFIGFGSVRSRIVHFCAFCCACCMARALLVCLWHKCQKNIWRETFRQWIEEIGIGWVAESMHFSPKISFKSDIIISLFSGLLLFERKTWNAMNCVQLPFCVYICDFMVNWNSNIRYFFPLFLLLWHLSFFFGSNAILFINLSMDYLRCDLIFDHLLGMKWTIS